MKILVVEDNKENILKAQEFFTTQSVDYAENLEEALDKIGKSNYDAIISDYLFPKNNSVGKELGVETAFELTTLFQKALGASIDCEITKEEFASLVEVAKKITDKFEQKRNDENDKDIRIFLSSYRGEVVTFLKDSLEKERSVLRESENERHCRRKIISNIREKLGQCWSCVAETALYLASNDRSLQPLGWCILKESRLRKIKYVVISDTRHHGCGIIDMLCHVVGKGRYAHVKHDQITKDTEVVLGNKGELETWRRATEFLLD